MRSAASSARAPCPPGKSSARVCFSTDRRARPRFAGGQTGISNLCDGCRTVSTGTDDLRTTFSATDPIIRCFRQVRPWAPQTITSASISFAQRRISRNGAPSRSTYSAGIAPRTSGGSASSSAFCAWVRTFRHDLYGRQHLERVPVEHHGDVLDDVEKAELRPVFLCEDDGVREGVRGRLGEIRRVKDRLHPDHEYPFRRL